MSGEKARKVFFSEKDFSFEQGHQLLRGAVPKLKDIKMMSENSNVIMLNKRLLKIVRKDRLQGVIPTLVSDVNNRMEAWGASGKMDPFKDIYDLVFQLTIRLSTCEELATNADSIKKISALYWQYEKSITAVGLLLPWFPGTAKKHQKQSTKGLYDILTHYVDVRRKAKVPNSDPFDILIADGESNAVIVEFALLMIFGGVVNTAMISCWTLFYLGANNEWKNKVIAEVRNLISNYSDASSSEQIHERFSSIPVSAWEDETPAIEGVIRETMRLIKTGPALRRNLADNLQFADKTVDKGAYVVYNMADVHLDEMVYSEPLKFDPSRFSPPREEDKQGHMLFLGWGAGRHICSGMKIAKLEIKMILALFLSSYEYTLVGRSGMPLKQSLQPDRNDIHQSKPLGEPCFLQYRKILE